MKKTILFIVATLCILPAMGQVDIQKIPLKEAIVKARTTDKKVMIVACATWCGPCQMLAKDVFPTKEAGDYFNDKLVVLKYEIDVDDSDNIDQVYQIASLPTIIFVDGNGEEYSRFIGISRSKDLVKGFIGQVEEALKPESSWAYMEAKLVSDPSYFPEFIKYAEGLYMNDKANDAVERYFNSKNIMDRFSKENLEIYRYDNRRTNSPVIAFMITNQQEVSEIMGEKEYRDFIGLISNRQLSGILRRLRLEKPETFENLKNDLNRIDSNSLYKTAFSDLVKNNFDNIKGEQYQALSDNSLKIMSGLSTSDMTEVVFLNVHLPITFGVLQTLDETVKQIRRKALVDIHEAALKYETDPQQLDYYRGCLVEYRKNYIANATEIVFFEGSWAEALVKAKRENKYIFVDCYTQWCGPCKVFAATTCKDPIVAAYFNANFINVKMDMEADGDGAMLQSKWQIGAFPSFLFVDSNEHWRHRINGFNDFDRFIASAKRLVDGRGFEDLFDEFERGNRSPDFFSEFFEVIRESAVNRDTPRLRKVMESYLATVEKSKWSEQENWNLFRGYILPDSEIFGYVWNNRNTFYQTLGKESVDKVLNQIWIDGAGNFTKNNGNSVVVDWNGFNAYVLRMQNEKVENYRHIEFLGKVHLWEAAEDWENYASLISSTLEQDPAAIDDALLNRCAHNIAVNCQDNSIRATAKDWLVKRNSSAVGILRMFD